MDQNGKLSSARLLRLLVIYTGCVLLNFLFSWLCEALDIPLYLDGIGILLAAIFGGYLPGIIVGFVTNLIKATISPESAFYAVISVLIAAAATFMANKGVFKKWWKSLISIPVFAFLGGFLGSILTYLLYGFGMGEGVSAPFAVKLLESGRVSVFSAQLISDVTIDLIDKTITVLIVMVLIRVIPKKISDSLSLTNWQQTPLDTEQVKESNATHVSRRALRTKIIMIIGSVMLFIAFATCTICYILYRQFAIEQMEAAGAGTVMTMEDVSLYCVRFITKVTSLFIGFFVVILVYCLWHMKYHLTYPINSMTNATRKFAYNTDEELDEGVARLAELNISTGDELETLYGSIEKMMADTVRHFEDIEAKGEQITKMQNGLIYILADIVESRDKCTGDHVKKTAAYVRLILELIKENGMYPDIVTDEYIEDVCHSAPLHDIGKIKVSDLILNKPARLTDEEFQEMKKHTTAGKKIIESAMELTGGSSGYIKEALNLATYHHEKWDGSGYPEGLKGEEIPLSARIMAVSDVFDALVSERSYKKAFTFEQAMDILKDGAGRHFDPNIVKLFSENPERVMEIERENRKFVNEVKEEQSFMKAV